MLSEIKTKVPLENDDPAYQNFLLQRYEERIERLSQTDKVSGQGDGVPKACSQQAAADSRGSRTCVCANTFSVWGGTRRGQGRINVLPWYRLVGAQGGSTGLPARVSGRHVVRGRQSSPTLEVRLGEQARLVKTDNIQVRWAAAHPGQDRRLPSVATHSRL